MIDYTSLNFDSLVTVQECQHLILDVFLSPTMIGAYVAEIFAMSLIFGLGFGIVYLMYKAVILFRGVKRGKLFFMTKKQIIKNAEFCFVIYYLVGIISGITIASIF